MKKKNSISVVIPNYNGKELLENNIPFVYSALKSSDISDFEIIISDDASVDNSVDFIKNNYPDIILIENTHNKGFSGNTNTGIFKACKELVFILNSDVVLTDGYFKHLLSYFHSTDTFGVGGKIIALDSDQLQDAAKYPDYSFGSIVSSTNYINQTETALYSFFLSCANALVDREKIIEMGGLNELFNPYYSEDVDLGLRAWRLGYKCYFEPKAICKHPNSATIKKEPGKKVKIISKRNKMFLHFIHLNNIELIYYITVLTIKILFRSIILDTNYLNSFYLFISSIKKCKISKMQFNNLQKQKQTNLSVRQVSEFIHKEIGQSTIKKF